MTPSDLYYFICKCLAMDDDPVARQQVEDEVTSGNITWEEFVWMGSSHFVLPALSSSFRRNGILPLMPGDLVEHLSVIYDINFIRNRQITEQSQNLIRILNTVGIEPVFLKGAGHLLQNLYHDPGDRIMSDIDILIPENDIKKAAKVLYDKGYFHPEQFKDDDFEKHHHLPGFEHPNYIAIVEIHHSLFPGRYSKLLSNAEISTEIRKLDGINAWVLSYKHQMILNFVHDQLVDDDFKYKTMLVKGLYDFYLLSKLVPIGRERASIKGYNKTFNTYCSFASSVFNTSKGINFTENFSSRRFKRQFEYLVNHPKVYGYYQFVVLYSLRITIILKTFITAPFSKQSRRYVRKKVGSLSAVKRYFKSLRREF